MVLAISSRASRRWARAALDESEQFQDARGKIECAARDQPHLAERIEREQPHVEPKSTDRDSGTHSQGVSTRQIARVLNLSRRLCAKSCGRNHPSCRCWSAPEKAEAYRSRSWSCWPSCKGNLVRVHEELTPVERISYQALTAFCRRHGIGQEPNVPAGRYHFDPGEEIQHDTSPHDADIGGKKRNVQTASAVLCYSRMLFFQCYPDLPALRLQSLSDRSAAILRRSQNA